MMTYFSDKLSELLAEKGLNPFQLHKKSGISKQLTYAICWGDRRPTDKSLKAIAEVSELGVAFETLKNWRKEDEYGDIQKIPPEWEAFIRLGAEYRNSLEETGLGEESETEVNFSDEELNRISQVAGELGLSFDEFIYASMKSGIYKTVISGIKILSKEQIFDLAKKIPAEMIDAAFFELHPELQGIPINKLVEAVQNKFPEDSTQALKELEEEGQ